MACMPSPFRGFFTESPDSGYSQIYEYMFPDLRIFVAGLHSVVDFSNSLYSLYCKGLKDLHFQGIPSLKTLVLHIPRFANTCSQIAEYIFPDLRIFVTGLHSGVNCSNSLYSLYHKGLHDIHFQGLPPLKILVLDIPRLANFCC